MNLELASSSWDEDEIEAIQDVMKSGMYTMGEKVRDFELEFAKKFGVNHAVMVTSGSMANLIGIASLFYRPENPLLRGDEVIVPAISWATTYYPLQQYGLRLRFVDVDLHTLNMDISKLEAALTPRTRMVVAVSILGNPAELESIRNFCDKNGLILFEDNCESMGAVVKDRYTGTFGDIGTFSCFYSHQMSTMEGGVLVTNNDEIYYIARSMRAHGWTRDIPEGTSIYERLDDDFFEAYRFIFPGYNARPLEFCGAVGLKQIKKLDALVEVRRRNAELFVELFNKDERFIIQRENGRSSWFSFTIILNPDLPVTRQAVLDSLRKAGVQFRIITGGCFIRHDVIRYFDYDIVGDTTNANIAHDRGFFVGNHPTDIRPAIEELYKVLNGSV